MTDWKQQAEFLLGKVTELVESLRTVRERLNFFETNCQCQANFSWCSSQLNVDEGSTTTIVLTENLPGNQFDPTSESQDPPDGKPSSNADEEEANSIGIVQNRDSQISFINGQFIDGTCSQEYCETSTTENVDLTVCQEIVVGQTLTTTATSQDTWNTVAVEWNNVTGSYELSTREGYSIVDISDCHPVDSVNNSPPSQAVSTEVTLTSLPTPTSEGPQEVKMTLDESRDFGCQLCPRKFRSKKQLDRHKLSHSESQTENLKCKFCEKIFKNSKLYKFHLSTHSEVATEPEELSLDKATNVKKDETRKIPPIVKYDCCREKFFTRKAFLQHWDAHPIPQPSIKCQYCEETFGVKTVWAVHEKEHRDKMLKIHDPRRNHQCELCGVAFLSRPHLNAHIRNHDKVKVKAIASPAAPFCCKICGRVYIKRCYFLSHMLRHKNNKSAEVETEPEVDCTTKSYKYHCEYCDKQFRSKGLLTMHVRFHTGDKVYKCNVCQQSFFTPYQLNGHRMTTSHGLSGRRKYQLRKESTTISNHVTENIIDNVKTTKTCDDGDKLDVVHPCVSQVDTKNNLVITVNRQTSSDTLSTSQDLTSTGVTQIIFYQCHICKDIFNCKDTLAQHLESHRAAMNKFHCTFCDTNFAYRKTWVLHQQTHLKELRMKGNNSAIVTCNVCKKEFPHLIALNCHAVVHAKPSETPAHVCKYCDRIYYSKAKLLVHERAHTGEKPFVCSICAKPFASVPSLRMHQESHDAELKCCTLCPKKFKSTRNLKVHQNIHNRVKSFECKLCGYFYETRSRLQIHMKSKLHAGLTQQNSIPEMEVPIQTEETVTIVEIPGDEVE